MIEIRTKLCASEEDAVPTELVEFGQPNFAPGVLSVAAFRFIIYCDILSFLVSLSTRVPK